MSNLLLSLSLGMFADAQALSSLTFDCLEWSSSDIPSGWADIRNCMSSANEWSMMECESIMTDKVLVCMLKSRGPWTAPWGTPECIGAKAELWLDRETYYVVHTISQIRCRPLKDKISKSKVSMETAYKNRMINCVKCWRKVKQGQYRYVAFVNKM